MFGNREKTLATAAWVDQSVASVRIGLLWSVLVLCWSPAERAGAQLPLPGDAADPSFLVSTAEPPDHDEGSIDHLNGELNELQVQLNLLEQSVRSGSGESSSASRVRGWFEKYQLGGYTQFRINETLWRAADSAAPSHDGDSSVADDQSFLIRRARLVLSGDVTDQSIGDRAA